ncbi:MAG: orotidine-5'-phosphate decarboxylase [Acidimicrobiia bacterium]|nr:orotidine-5'-phosphate decarboxylase [Acidimicrobiia bacterium]
MAKIGLELWAAGGPAVVEAIADMGVSVFLDLKLHDIPTTVGKAARVLGGLPIAYLTVHTSGGVAMCEAAADGVRSASSTRGSARGVPAPAVLGVTVLTSDADTSPFDERLDVAAQTCDGVVCSVHEVATVRSRIPATTIVTPGIRLAGSAVDDQARVSDPASALAAGSDLLVIGRTVTAASDPDAAAAAVSTETARALRGS